MEAIDFGQLAPLFQQELGHRNGLEKIGEKAVGQRGVLVGSNDWNRYLGDGGLAFLASAAAQPLGQGADRPGRPNLALALDVADVNDHRQATGTERGGGCFSVKGV